MRCLGLVLVLVLCGSAVSTHAASPRVWRTGGVGGWEAVERDSVGLASDGTIHLGLARIPMDEGLDALTVWDLLSDGDGVLAATGDGGVLYRVDRDGTAAPLVTVIQPELTCVARDGAGRVVFGAAPDGMVYRVEDGEAVPVADLPESYVWDLVPGPDGRLLAATGEGGAVYRLGDRPERWAEVEAGHVTGLLVEGNEVLATTDSPGLLLRIDTDGAVGVLHESSEPELRNPVRGADGDLYFLANPEEESAGVRLYRRTAEGAVEQVWTAASGYGYDLVAVDGALWVATGSASGTGALTRVEPGPPTTWSRAFTCPEPQVTAVLVADGRPAWAATGSLGRVYRVPGAPAPDGVVRSTVLDAGAPARWGRAAVEPGPDPAGLVLETRSGNTNVPGASWSEWREVDLGADGGPVPSPGARFLQWRLGLSDPDRRVAGVRVAYLPANRPPQVASVEVSALGAPLDRSSDRQAYPGVAQTLPGGVRIEIQSGNGSGPGRAPDDEAAWARRYRAVSWTTGDPDGDELRHSVAVRAAGETAWHVIAEDLEDSPWVWDSATVPDGWYEVRLLADDGRSNPPSAALESGRASEAFRVDNTAPMVENLAYADDEVRGVARDASTPLRELEAAVDGGEWRRVFPEDGIPDSRREAFRVPLDDVGPGEHVILVRAVDEGGNMGVARLRFTVGGR